MLHVFFMSSEYVLIYSVSSYVSFLLEPGSFVCLGFRNSGFD